MGVKGIWVTVGSVASATLVASPYAPPTSAYHICHHVKQSVHVPPECIARDLCVAIFVRNCKPFLCVDAKTRMVDNVERRRGIVSYIYRCMATSHQPSMAREMCGEDATLRWYYLCWNPPFAFIKSDILTWFEGEKSSAGDCLILRTPTWLGFRPWTQHI